MITVSYWRMLSIGHKNVSVRTNEMGALFILKKKKKKKKFLKRVYCTDYLEGLCNLKWLPSACLLVMLLYVSLSRRVQILLSLVFPESLIEYQLQLQSIRLYVSIKNISYVFTWKTL